MLKGALDYLRGLTGPRARPAHTGLADPVYAIGDIHGRRDLLARLLDKIRWDMDRLGAAGAHWVFLGDYVDRGPDTPGVIDAILKAQGDGIEVIALKGNHDAVMSEFLREPSLGVDWIQFGGDAVLAAYGVAQPPPDAGLEAWRACAEALWEAMPDEHRAFLDELKPSWRTGDYFFAHAGVDPNKPLDRQDPRDLMWIRAGFLDDRRRLDCVIVHGHTPSDEAFRDHRRIGVDTGAYMSGRLTAVRLLEEEVTFLQASDDSVPAEANGSDDVGA